MGYYTYFSLQVYGPQEDYEAMKKAASELTDDPKDDSWKERIKELVETDGLEAKWYTFDADIIEWAEKFPTLLFVINGDGEESDDVWELRIKGAEAEKRYVCLPPLQNENLRTESEKLKDIMNQNK